MGSRLPPTNSTASEICNQSSGDEPLSAELAEMTHVVAECGDGQLEKPPSSFSNTETDQQENVSSVTSQSPSTDKLIPPDKRVNGLIFGSVIGHTYTDNKQTNLDTWLPEALNQTAAKRRILMDLEQKVAKFISEDTNQQYLVLKSSDTYQRLAIYRVTAYFGLECRSKDGDLIACRTPYTRIPEDNIRFQAMLRELPEEREGVDMRPVDQSGDMRSIPIYPHIREPSPVFYQRQSYIPMQPTRYRNPNVQSRFGPSQPPFTFNVTTNHPLSGRVLPPVRRYIAGNARFRGSLPPGGHFMNNHHARWTAPSESMSMSSTFDGPGSSGAGRSRSVPNVSAGVDDSDDMPRSTGGVTSKTYDKQSVADSSDFGDCSANSDTKAATETDVSYSGGMEPGFAATGTGVMTPDQRLVSSNTALMAQANNAVLNKDQNCGTHLTEDSETKRYTITQQLAAMTIENSNKDVGSSKEGMDRLAMSSGAVVLLTSGSGSTQYAVQDISNSSSGCENLPSGPPPSQVTVSPVRMGVPPYPPPPPAALPRPSTLNIYGSHANTVQTQGQPTFLMVADSQGYIQASPQVGHTYPIAAAVAAASAGGASLDSSSVMPIFSQPQSVVYLTPQQLAHQPHHQMPSFIYLNPIQPSPVLSSSGQSSEYTVAQYRDVPPPSAGPPPPPAVPYSLYPQLQQVAVSMPPPAPSGLTYYATPNEVLYSGAICSQASQPVNSHESVHYTSSTAMPIAGYTWSPYIPQQVSSPPAGGFVNYFPTAAAYTGAYAASTPLVFQPTTGYSMPPPSTDMPRLPSEVQRPVQFVPLAGGKGTGFVSGVHIAPSTPSRPLNVADVQLVGQPITMHPFVPVAQLSASQRMDGAAPVLTGGNPPSYRMPPPTNPAYQKSAAYGIRPSAGSFRSAGSAAVTVQARPSNLQYQ